MGGDTSFLTNPTEPTITHNQTFDVTSSARASPLPVVLW
jgi:hypothetical protein